MLFSWRKRPLLTAETAKDAETTQKQGPGEDLGKLCVLCGEIGVSGEHRPLGFTQEYLSKTILHNIIAFVKRKMSKGSKKVEKFAYRSFREAISHPSENQDLSSNRRLRPFSLKRLG